MQINKDTSFIETYFNNKTGEQLRSTITPSWNDKTIEGHLSLVKVPDYAQSVLEVGCGIGRLLRPLAERGIKCYGIDASEAMVDESSEYLTGVNHNISLCSGYGDIPLKDNLVDFSYCIITFQHIPNTETVKKYISEMVRVTKPGGEIMFQVLSEDLDKGYLWSYHKISKLLIHLTDLGIQEADMKKIKIWSIIRCRV